MNASMDLNRHPCFNPAVKGACGRVHLPVAPHCNIRCNYCNRKYACVNESRPGVTSAVLSPDQAAVYMEEVLAREPRISVAGIAGPGDPFADPEETLATLRIIKKRFPHILLCLSTNGFAIGAYVDEIARIGVSHVTITVNAVDPQIGRLIYGWARDGKVIYRGVKAAQVLLDRQIEAIKRLKGEGIVVKVNTIVVPTVNDRHVEDVARTMAQLGVDLLNCMPMYPNADTPFEHIEEPGKELIDKVRAEAGRYLPQMLHCARCRADAVGLLAEDRSEELRGCLARCAGHAADLADRPYAAVATLEGVLVNQHLGEACSLQIWSRKEDGFHCIEERKTPEPGGGLNRWKQLGNILKDCRALLVAGIGENPAKALAQAGVKPLEVSGFIEAALAALYSGESLDEFKSRRPGGCSKGIGCSGSGEGC